VKHRLVFAVTALALLGAPLLAGAQEQPKKWGSFELGGGPYIPNVDDEFDGTASPYRDIFGGKPRPMFRLHVGKTFFQSPTIGVLEVGARIGFWSKTGRAVDSGGAPTGDRARFTIVPTSLTLTYRADMLYERMRVPLVPYARATLERYNWWTSKEDERTQVGATNGWSATAGLALVIDWLDPDAARDLGNETGIAHTMLYFDLTKSQVDDFGSDESWDLSEKQTLFWSAGMMVVF
jgi:hypothetical protein